MRLDVQLQVRRQAALQVGADAVLDVVIQPWLVHVDDEGVRVEGVVEVVDQNRKTPDLLWHGLADLVLDIFRDRPESGKTVEAKHSAKYSSGHKYLMVRVWQPGTMSQQWYVLIIENSLVAQQMR